MRHETIASNGQAHRQILVRAAYRTGHRIACLFMFLTGLLLMPSLVVDLLKLILDTLPHESLMVNIALRAGLGIIFLPILAGLFIAFKQTRDWPLHGAKTAIRLPTFESPVIAAVGAVLWVLLSNTSLAALGYSLTARGLFCIYLLTTRPEMLAAYAAMAFVGLAICFARASLHHRELTRAQTQQA